MRYDELEAAILQLVRKAVEQIDFQVSADLDDFLAEPEMAAEYERIKRHLGG